MNKPRIQLINPPSDCVVDDRKEPHLGLLYIASTLREKGYDNIIFYDMTGSVNQKNINSKISNIPDADIYGISCMSTNYIYSKNIISHIKKNNPNAYIVSGGPHPSAMPELMLNDAGVDSIIIGEGEDAFCDLVDAYMKDNPVFGIVNGKYRKDIDSYAFPARDFVDLSSYSRKLLGKPTVSIISSRGCMYRCIHCNSNIMGGGSSNVRYRHSDNIIAEIKQLNNTFSSFRFNDDHFTGNPSLELLLRKLSELKIKFRIFARIEDLNEKICKLLHEAGCVHVTVGLESLNPDNLKVISKGKQSGKEGNIINAHRYGLIVRASFIVGLPFDNDKTVEYYFSKASDLGIDEYSVYPLIPYPGTMLWSNPEKYGYDIINKNFTDYIQLGKNKQTCYALRHRNFGPIDVKRWLVKATEILENGTAKHISKSCIAQ